MSRGVGLTEGVCFAAVGDLDGFPTTGRPNYRFERGGDALNAWVGTGTVEAKVWLRAFGGAMGGQVEGSPRGVAILLGDRFATPVL